MVEQITLRLKNYISFLEKFRPEQQAILHLGITVQRYFDFAEIQANIFNEKIKNMYDRSDEEGFSDMCYSSCFATYVHIRTCLEANQRLADELQKLSSNRELQVYRDNHVDEIKGIINIANDMVKHPLDKDGKVYFYEPGGYDNSGNVTLHEWSTVSEEYFELPKIKPINDLRTVFNYLEGIAEIYLKIIEPTNSNTAVPVS